MPTGNSDLTAMDDEGSGDIAPRQLTLRDRTTVATLVPFHSYDQIPKSLIVYLCNQLNREIEKGDTYAMVEPIPVRHFAPYWFSNFGAIMLIGDIKNVHDVQNMDGNVDWAKACLGSFNVRPNYPGRSSHVCNGMFLVTDAARNKGVGRLMGEAYLDWATRLGYTYAVFNLIYESNVASCRLWEGLGFKRIGRVPGAGKVLSSPGEFVDAIIYGRDLGSDGEDPVTQDRFDKIRYYLKHSKYPRGADRAEKSRLRSAATHYKLIEDENGGEEKLMLKDKEVVSDPQQQYEIAQQMHMEQHAGINKTTAAIATKYHWVRIKETVSRVIRDCPHCKETLKIPSPNSAVDNSPGSDAMNMEEDTDRDAHKQSIQETHTHTIDAHIPQAQTQTESTPQLLHPSTLHQNQHQPQHPTHPFAPTPTPPSSILQGHVGSLSAYTAVPLDPQIMNLHSMPRFQTHDAMGDPYGTGHGQHSHTLHDGNGNLRHVAPNEYHMMVDDPGDGDSLGVNVNMNMNVSLGHGHGQGGDVGIVHHENLLKYQYVAHGEDELDFT
ncbi:putative histone acetyltransferase Spt10 [Aspergillus undulatus]|uniref:putative histone acetyltransferase Spt10 n=1 Tax=Aspergillus undulatus TaxID=1810928 RepID=UPI003CCDBBC9